MDIVINAVIKKKKDISGNVKHDTRITIPKSYDLRNSNKEKNTIVVNGNQHTISGNSKELASEIKKKMEIDIQIMEDLYLKKHGKKMPKNTTKFVEGVISFGVSDEQKMKRETHLQNSDSLTDEETEYINNLDREKMLESAKKYIKKLNEKYGIEVEYLVEHRDEKTVHYHFIAPNFNFQNSQTIYKNMGKRELSQFGIDIQDKVPLFVKTTF